MKQIRRFVISGIAVYTLLHSPSASYAEPAGWQGMRVIHQEGRPQVIRVADVNGDGRDELIVVNSQHSRLDVYRWLAPEQRDEATVASDANVRPNDLPMPGDFRRDEILLKHLPQDVVVADLNSDGQQELSVLAAPPNKVLIYASESDGDWKLQETLDLLPGDSAPRHNALLLDRSASGVAEVFVGCTNGVQQLTLSAGSRPRWLTPRERRGREGWWVADVDGDGDLDLVEQARDADQSLRWFERTATNHLAPAQILFDQSIDGATVLPIPDEPAQMLLLDGATSGLLRRYRLSKGDANPLGNRQTLALKDGRKAIWCGIQVGNRPALVLADTERPRLLMYPLEADGWGEERSFPVINNVRAIAAPTAAPGMLLLWAEDEADLHVSSWDGGRMSYPKRYSQETEDGDRSILALGSVGDATWWLQQVDNDCDLYVWHADQPKAKRSRFEGVKLGKGGQIQWLGGERLLVRQDYRASVSIASLKDGKTTIKTAAHLRQTSADELKLVAIESRIRVARLSDGVLQWLDDDLQPIDQVMLPQERQLSDYAALDVKQGWALEEGGQFVHRLEADETGIAQVRDMIRMNGGLVLRRDPTLGLILVSHNQLTKLEPGRPNELELLESIDGRISRRSGVKEATIHRVNCVDIDGDGNEEVLLFDDRRHQLTVLREQDGKFKPHVSWPVFEDKKYPYSDEDDGPKVTEPRVVVAWDADGDGRQDLAMACHDRLLIYLAREEP